MMELKTLSIDNIYRIIKMADGDNGKISKIVKDCSYNDRIVKVLEHLKIPDSEYEYLYLDYIGVKETDDAQTLAWKIEL